MGPRGAHAATHIVRPRLPQNYMRINSSGKSIDMFFISPSSLTLIIIILLVFLPPNCWCVLGAQEDAAASTTLLRFKSSLTNADPALANWNPSTPPCNLRSAAGNWVGVLCYNGYVLGLQLENMSLSGQIDVDSLVSLRYLRTLSFMNNKFEGPMPDWRKIGRLKSLFLSNNQFSGQISDDAFKGMASLKKVHMANNKFIGHIPTSLQSPKLMELRLENNKFTGPIPPFRSEHLKVFNISNNQLEGPIPQSLLKLNPSSFSGNQGLCGKPLGVECIPPIPPPDMEPNLGPPSNHVSDNPSPPSSDKSKPSSKIVWVIVICIVFILLLAGMIIFIVQRHRKSSAPQHKSEVVMPPSYDDSKAAPTDHQDAASTIKKGDQHQQPGKLSFVRDDRQKFDLQDLMRASAEVLGSGNFGASYKAVLVDGEALVVKRFKQMNSVAKEDFHEHMRRLGRLRHPNLLPLVAYLYRKEEKLLVFDYIHNGSLAAHLHGKHSEEKPGLRWTTRLQIIKGVAKGLSYLHNELPSLTVPHGHLKSSNILLDQDFNPLLMDYTLIPVVNPTQVQQILVAYKSPEYAQLGRTSKKTDVWCLGILILETLTGKFVAKYLAQGSAAYGEDLAGWVNDIVQKANTNVTQVFDKEMSVDGCMPQMERLLRIGIACCKEDLDQRWDLEEATREIVQVQHDEHQSS